MAAKPSTGHDPLTTAGQAQLALGLQALDIQSAATDRSNSGLLTL